MATNLQESPDHPLARDQKTIESWLAGDPDAEKRLFACYRPILHRFIESWRVSDAEDLVQQVLLACVVGRTRLKSASYFRAYLFGTARNCIKADWRQRQRNVLPLQPLPRIPTVEDMLLHDERMDRLTREIERLPAHLREVLDLYYSVGFSGARIAKRLDVPEGTVRSRVRHAVKRLRVALESDDASVETGRPPLPDQRRPRVACSGL